MSSTNKQGGLTTISMLALAMICVVMAICVIKLAPSYMESLTVRDILQQIAEEVRGEDLDRAQVRERISKKLLINSVKGLKMQNVKVKGDDRGYVINANYEVRKHLFLNVDVVLVFDDMQVEARRA